tara:strand:+ start:37 stop:279 length:243 start_codon:yes stop_codon:yes gene_type:complete
MISKNEATSYWSFIEKYYPNYHSCNDILMSDILSRKLEGEFISKEDEEIIKDWNIKVELLELDQKVFSKALESYLNITYP